MGKIAGFSQQFPFCKIDQQYIIEAISLDQTPSATMKIVDLLTATSVTVALWKSGGA